MLDPADAAYALLLGAVAAFNPCGFALLPAYLTVLVTGSAEEGVTRAAALRRAVLFGLAMTTGFMAVFLAFGLLFGAVNIALQGAILPYVSYVTVVIGVALVALGAILAVTGELRGPGLRVRTTAPRRSFLSQVAYGATFAVASLSCTIGLFLGVVAQSVGASGAIAAILPFVIYGAGMGAAILAVSMAAALAGATVASALRRHTPTLMRVGGVIMIVAGLYVTVFGLAEVLPRFGITTLDGVLTTTLTWQSSAAAWIGSWGTTILVVVVTAVLTVAALILVRGRRAARATHSSTSEPQPPQGEGADKPTIASAIRTADAATLDAIRRAARRDG